MARKIECDRCKKQWVPEPHDDEKELCRVGFDIPWRSDLPPVKSPGRQWTPQPRIDDAYDMCQDCARAIHKFATTPPEDYGDHD